MAVGVGVLVLLLLGGGAATAAKWIDGKRIKPGSVTAKQLRNKSVKTAKLAPGAVGSKQLKDGSVTAAKLASSVGITGPAGPTGSTGAIGATGPTGPSGSSTVFGLRDEPNFLIPSSSATMVSDEAYPLGPAAYLLSGYLGVRRADPGEVSISCDLFQVFVDSAGFQVGALSVVGTPAATVPGGGTVSVPVGSATIPVDAVVDLSSPPPGAAEVEVRIACQAVADDAVVAERQLMAVPFDQANLG